MGLIGSLIGIALGTLLVVALRGAFGSLLNLDLVLSITPGPMLAGLVMGLVVATTFGFLPTLTAARVRPATVLRPADAAMPRAGLLDDAAGATAHYRGAGARRRADIRKPGNCCRRGVGVVRVRRPHLPAAVGS